MICSLRGLGCLFFGGENLFDVCEGAPKDPSKVKWGYIFFLKQPEGGAIFSR